MIFYDMSEIRNVINDKCDEDEDVTSCLTKKQSCIFQIDAMNR